ncbi:MAG: hypothetical protein HZA54_13975, partial [Planctomycetes bacterium]|nr:hypothetical protein [Planctomycetota bacterium]
MTTTLPRPSRPRRPRRPRAPAAAAVRGAALLLLLAALLALPLRAEDPQLAPPPAVARSVEQARARLRQRFAAVEHDLARIDRSAYDVEARAALLADGLEPAFAFVRDETIIEGYPGLLRGAAGTLRARAGNSLDRALLLGRLLEKKGYRFHLARGRLTPKQVNAWLEAEREKDLIPPDPHRKAEPAAPVAEVGAGPAAAATGLEFAQLDERAGRALAALRKDMKLHRFEWDGRRWGTEDLARRSLADHWWVLALDGGRWVDLDPSFLPAPGFGRRAVEMAAEYGPDQVLPFTQTITLRLHLEQVTPAGLVDREVLEVTAPAWSLDGERFSLSVVPTLAGEERFHSGAASAAEAATALAGELVFVPCALIGDRRIPGRPFDVRGNLVPPEEFGRPYAVPPWTPPPPVLPPQTPPAGAPGSGPAAPTPPVPAPNPGAPAAPAPAARAMPPR